MIIKPRSMSKHTGSKLRMTKKFKLKSENEVFDEFPQISHIYTKEMKSNHTHKS